MTIRSILPSPFMSPVAIVPMPLVRPTACGELAVNATSAIALVTWNGRLFDAPPPGPGFTTVTDDVPAEAISVCGTLAVSFDELANTVARGLPFQFTTEPATNPVPVTVSVKPGPPGARLDGDRGSFTSGTGFDCAPRTAATIFVATIRLSVRICRLS